jgi:ATP-dependent Clp protease ATP-binding subunit ClpA
MVVDKFIMQLEAQLTDRNVEIELDVAARDWISKKGYHPTFGARPLARVVQEEIKKPLADHLLFGDLTSGGIVKVTVADNKLVLDVSPHEPRGKQKAKRSEPV